MASYMIPPITGGPSTPWNYQNNPYRQRAAPVGTLDAPIGSNPGGNPFSGIPGLSAGQYPGVSPDIWSQVMGVVNPQLQNAADIINRRSAMGSGAITGLTNFMANEMGGLQGMVGQAYDQGIKLGKNVANWSNTSLTKSGAAQDASVAQQMASAGPLAKSSDLNLTQEGKGAGGAAYGTGIAEVDNLIAARAAAQTRSALEPTFAAMTGQQQQGMLGAQLARQLADMQGNITSQIPQLLLDLQDRAQSKAESDRNYQLQLKQVQAGQKSDKLTQLMNLKDRGEASTGYQYVITSTGIHPRLVNGKKVPTATTAADKRKDAINTVFATHIQPDGTLDPQGVKILQGMGLPAGSGTDTKTATTLAKAGAPNSALSKVFGYVVDGNGNPLLKNGKTVPVATTSAGAPRPNVQLSRALGQWVDQNGNLIPQLNKSGVPAPPSFFKPSKGKTAKAPTAAVIASGWESVKGHQIMQRAQAKVDAYNKKQIAAGMKRGGVPWEKNPITLDQLDHLTPAQKADIGVTTEESTSSGHPQTLQEVYIALVHSGIPAQRAWSMVRKYYPKWGQGYFK